MRYNNLKNKKFKKRPININPNPYKKPNKDQGEKEKEKRMRTPKLINSQKLIDEKLFPTNWVQPQRNSRLDSNQIEANTAFALLLNWRQGEDRSRPPGGVRIGSLFQCENSFGL